MSDGGVREKVEGMKEKRAHIGTCTCMCLIYDITCHIFVRREVEGSNSAPGECSSPS